MPAVVRSFQEKKDNPKYRAAAEAFAQKHGISLDDVIFVKDFDDEGNPVSDDVEVRQRTSILGSIGKEFAAGVAPTAAATLAGGAVGAATTVATAPKLGPLAPVAGGAAGLTTALGTGIAGELLARKALKTYTPSWNRELEIANQSHPNWSMVGGVLSGGVAQRNLPRHLIGAALKRGTAKSFGERVALDPVIKEVIPAGQKFTTALALNLATSVGAGAGGDIAMQMANAVSTPGKQDIDYWRSIKAGLLAPIAGGGAPRFGRKLMMEPARRIAAGQMRTAAGEAPVTVPPGTDRKAAAKAYQEALKKAPDDATRGRITAEMAENYSFTPESVDAYLAKIDQQDAAAAEKTPTQQRKEALAKGHVEDAIVDQDMVKWLITNKRLNVGGKQKKMTTSEAEEFLQNPESAAFKEAYRVAKEAEKSASPPEKPAAPTTETTDAVPKQSTETLPPLETPKVGETVGGKVPSTKGTAREEGGPTVPPKTEVTPEIISEAEKIVGERLVHLPSKSASALWKEHGGGLFEKLIQTDKAKWMDEDGKLAPDTIWNYFEELVRTKSGAIKRGDAARLVSDPDQKIAEAVAAGKELPPPEPRAKNSLPPAEAVPPRPNPLPEVPRGPEFNPIKNPAHKTFEGVLKQLGETEASYTRKIEDSPWVPDKTGVPVKQGTSAIEGIGNFTTQDLQAGAEIAPAFVPSETNPKEFIRTATGRFTNHSDSPNARIENIYGPDGVRSVLTANRALKAGEELTIDYPSAAKMIEELDNFLKTETIPLKSKAGRKVIPPKKSAAAKPLEVPREPTVERPQDIPAADRKARLEAAWDAAKAYGEDLAKSGKEVSPLSVAAERALTAATEYLPNKEAFHIASLFTKHLKAGGAKDKAIADVLRYLKSAEKKAISKEGQPVKAAVKKARKPITGEAGALGAWGDVARATSNVTQDIITGAKKAGNKIGEVLREINKGFEAGRNAADRPSFISAAVVDALRPRGDELYSFPPHIIFAKMSQAIGKLVGKPAMFMTKRLARGAGEALRELHPVMGNYIMDNTIPTFQLEQRKMFNEFLAPLYEAGNLKLSREQWNKIGQYSIDMDEYGASAITLSAEELKGYNYTRASYDASKLAQDADGPAYSGRAAHLTENFYPNSVLSEKVRKILMSTNKEDAAERNRIVALQRDWHRRQDPKATTKDMDAHLAALLGKGVFLGKRDPTFSPLFKAEGIGIHPDLRETHAFKVAQFYGMRSATGLAWYRAVQKDPIAARIFGVANNGKGKSYVSPETDTIDPTMLPGSDGDFAADAYEIKDYSAYPEYARNLSHDPSVEYFRSEMGLGLRSNYDWVDQATALVNSMKLGPRTVLRDVLASLPISIETATSAEVAKYWGPALEKVILGKSEATKVGAVRAKDTAEMAIDNTVRNTMGKITDVMRKYQGRDLFERGIREALYEFYHSVADARLKANDVEFLEAWGGKKWKDYTPDVLLPRMATKLMENVQGNYTGEYLPAAIGKGAAPNFLKTTFSLSRWSIERMRRYRQTVLKPLAEKGDWKPFLRSSFMHQFFAAPAVAAIEQFITGLKPQELTWAEWLGLAKDDGRPDDNKLDELAYTILAKAQLTGMGGMLSSLALNAYQLKHGEATYGFQNPFWQSAEDLVGRILQFWGTHSGPELLLAPFSIPLETVLQETQTARLLRNRIKKVGETGMREEKIWKRMTGQTSPGMASFMRGNPWDPKRRISRAQSMEEIVKEIPGLVKSYKEYTPGGPTRFAKRERPLDYYSFLKTIQGTPAAAGQFQGDIQNDTLNTLRDAAARAAFTTAVEDKTPLERLQLNRRISR
jgi:hypothetical protein